MSSSEDVLECLGVPHRIYDNSLFVPAPTYKISALKWLKNNYIPSDNEIWIISYPKTGTTFTQQICHQIMECYYNKTKNNDHIYYKENNDKYSISEWIVPLKARDDGAFNKFIDNTRNTKRFWKTHCKFKYLPCKILPKKMIICCRNPKDSLISMYHHTMNIPQITFKGSFDTFFSKWICGLIENDSYFKYYQEYWQFYKENLRLKKHEIYWLNYEDLVINKDSKRKEIRKLIEFIGVDDIVGGDDDIDEIINKTSVGSMKKQYDGFMINNFVRSGSLSDWKNYLSMEQSQIIDGLIKVYFNGTDFKYYKDLLRQKQYLCLKSKL